jgi:hypothetical protein
LGFDSDEAACTSSVSSRIEAPVVVDVASMKFLRMPVSKSIRMRAVQLYRPICCKGGPLVLGNVMTVGLAPTLVEDEADTGLDELTTEDESTVVVACEASWRRSNPRLFSRTALDSGIVALIVSVEATTREP